jgi:hypothetical protein
LLPKSDLPLSAVADAAGFSNQSRFTNVFSQARFEDVAEGGIVRAPPIHSALADSHAYNMVDGPDEKRSGESQGGIPWLTMTLAASPLLAVALPLQPL